MGEHIGFQTLELLGSPIKREQRGIGIFCLHSIIRIYYIAYDLSLKGQSGLIQV
ncbi:hypothetical protein YC2023_005259 [Brassica napus]